MRTISTMLTASILLFSSAQLQGKECAKCKLMAAWGLAAQPATLFDSANVARYEGQVISVQEVNADDGVVEGVYVLLKTTDGNMAVRLGPMWYLQKQGFSVEPRQNIEIMASKVKTEDDKQVLIATKAKRGDKTVALRNPQGVVAWESISKKK